MADQSGGRESPVPVQITVFNQTYRVVSTDGGERAARVAQLVDARMREVASQITTHEVAKIAIIAALDIADDLLRLQENDKARGDNEDDAPTASQTSWFDSVFDSELGSAQRRAGRMSSQFTERLQAARQPDSAASVVGSRTEIKDESKSGGEKEEVSDDGRA
jgi:cell division protein ZapA